MSERLGPDEELRQMIEKQELINAFGRAGAARIRADKEEQRAQHWLSEGNDKKAEEHLRKARGERDRYAELLKIGEKDYGHNLGTEERIN